MVKKQLDPVPDVDEELDVRRLDFLWLLDGLAVCEGTAEYVVAEGVA